MGKANLKRWVLSFERNVETDNKLWEGVPESWSNDRKSPFTQRCSDMWDEAMNRTDESDDLVDRE